MVGTSHEDFSLTVEDLQAVTDYALAGAVEVLPIFQKALPDDPRPEEAIAAARAFVETGRRTNQQRAAAFAAHRAAKDAGEEAARLAAQAAGDAAAAAYLHPIAKSHQVGHILRAVACVAAIAEIQTQDPDAGSETVRRWAAAASPAVVTVLRRYPPAAPGRSRTDVLMAELDASLRARHSPDS